MTPEETEAFETPEAMSITYVTKGGKTMRWAFEIPEGKKPCRAEFDRWFSDRIQHECGMFPTMDGLISVEALLSIEWNPMYRGERANG